MTAPILARELRTIPLHLLKAPAVDARLDRDEAQLEELGRDIETRGLIYPLHVFVADGWFEIVDGYCRFLASQRRAIVALECFVYPTKDDALEGVKYAANAFRQEMSPADEAKFFLDLYEGICEGDLQRVAVRCGKSLAYVQNRLELLEGDDEVFLAVRAKTISLGVAKVLNKFPDESWRRYYLAHSIKSGATVSMVESWLQAWKVSHGGPAAPTPEAVPMAPIVNGPSYDPHRCVVCGKSDPRYVPQTVSVHTHCMQANLVPMIAAFRGVPETDV